MLILVLHGAMVAGGYADFEGDLLVRARAMLGPAVPLGALLDLHGNVTPAMIGSSALLIACNEYPHTDYPARTAELYAALSAAARGAPMPSMRMRRVPMLGLFGSTEGPMRDFVRLLKACEQMPGIVSVSAMHGFAWPDTAATGAAILVACDGNDDIAAAAAGAQACQLAGELFALRSLAHVAAVSIEQAIDEALATRGEGDLIVLADGADNPGGGAACDSTFVLRSLLDRGVERAALGMIWDPQAALIAADAGVGARIAWRIGGKIGVASGDPVDVIAEVLAVRDDACQRGLGGAGSEFLGLAVAIRAGGVDIVLNLTRQQVFSPECFPELGIDLASKRIVVVKSSQHFRVGFDPIAAATIYCDAPGTLNSNLPNLPYKNLSRPIWPLDAINNLPSQGLS